MTYFQKLANNCCHKNLLILLFLGLLLMTTAHAASYTYTNSVQENIPEESANCSAQVTKTFTVTNNIIVDDVNIGVALEHDRRNDLLIKLRSPSGQEMLLLSAAAQDENMSYMFDDEAAHSVEDEDEESDEEHSTDSNPYEFTARPPTSLAVFDGEQAFGTWSLTICDRLNRRERGQFLDATLIIEERFVSPPDPAPTLPLSCQAANMSTNWTTTNPSRSNAGALTTTITTSANAGANWGAISNGAMNSINAWSPASVQNRTSWQTVFYWDTNPEPSGENSAFDTSNGQITFSWPRPVTNPIIHIDRLGGSGGVTPQNDQTYNYSNGMRFVPTGAGLVLARVAGPDHFEVTTDYVQRRPFERMADGSTNESNLNSTLGTTAGSFSVLGTHTSLSFTTYGVGTEGSGADGIEIVMCIPQSDVSLTQAVSSNSVSVGGTVTITLTVNNAAGGDPTNGLQVTDALPAGLSFVSATPSQGSYDDTTGLWSVGTVNAGGSATLTITATADAVGVYDNDAYISVSGLTDVDATDTTGLGVDDLGDGVADDDETTQRITVTAPTTIPTEVALGTCAISPSTEFWARRVEWSSDAGAGGFGPKNIDNSFLSGADRLPLALALV